MGYDNEMTVNFSGVSENEAFARTVIAAFILRLNPSVAELAEVKTAVSEAVTNAVIHGYYNYDTEGTVDVMCGTTSRDRDIYIEVRDSGRGISDIKEAMSPLYTSQPEMERSGMGFTVMETFMDSVEVISQPGSGTTVVMKKKLSG